MSEFVAGGLVLILEQNTKRVTYNEGSKKIKADDPAGLRVAIMCGAALVEQLDSRESRTGTADYYYTKWKVWVPVEMIKEIRAGKFDGLALTAPVPM